jgi:hypothetical protein
MLTNRELTAYLFRENCYGCEVAIRWLFPINLEETVRGYAEHIAGIFRFYRQQTSYPETPECYLCCLDEMIIYKLF